MKLFVCAIGCALIPALVAICQDGRWQPQPVEQLSIQSQLPKLMQFQRGDRIESAEQWKRRRAEIKAMLLHYQYGSMPPRPDRVVAENIERREHESGLGTIESITLLIESQQQLLPLRMRLLMFVPHSVNAKGPLPVIIREEGTLDGNNFVPTFFENDYIFIEYARHDLDPDKNDVVGPAQQAYPDHDWATLSVWAWGGMRVVDYLETRHDVDMRHIGITGHSRGGKMALLAGALDERFSLVVPVQSGAGGAGSYTLLGPGAESLAMNDKPHWYADRIQMFVGQANKLPFDQHFLKALVAPRALLCVESVDDDYANPAGTQLTTIAAQPAFDLYGNEAVDRNGLTYRNGAHSFTENDWKTLLDYAQWHFRGRKPTEPRAYQARPFDLPNTWYPAAPATAMQKGTASERVRLDNQASPGADGYCTIDDVGNEPAEDYFGMGCFGAVEYRFEIGMRQVTNAEYCEFLNAVLRRPTDKAVLYDSDMDIRRERKNGANHFSVPAALAEAAVTHTTWYDAARYCNWLHHGKPSGSISTETTEDGAYTLNGPLNASKRNADAKFALPTDNEWFKAAYYNGQSGYRLYKRLESGGLHVIQHAGDALSHYEVTGMFDRLWEWNENQVHGLFRSIRSGAWFVGNNRQAAGRLYSNPDLQLPNIGFRIVRLGTSDH